MPRSKRPAAPTRNRKPLLRTLPQVDELLGSEPFRAPIAEHGRDLIAGLVRQQLTALRAEINAGGIDRRRLGERIEDLGPAVGEEAARLTTSSIRPVINATGVVLHTNLGRALLSERAIRRMAEVARSYTTLEYDLARGRRGSRTSHLDRLLGTLFPRRASQVVNNNAAAVLLALNTLAEGREVIVSRGELVEIGGSFRIPDIMRKSGAILREVGSTNKTRLADYERAIGPKTALLLKVHPSNYRIVGFTAQVTLREVASLGRRRRIPVMMDQGSGNLVDLGRYGVRDEPGVGDALAAGADLVCCSGDKLLGGPQAGLLLGKPALIKRTRENPLSRALRVDKMTYAALEAALLEYVRGSAADDLPVMRMIALSREAIQTAGGTPGRSALFPRRGGRRYRGDLRRVASRRRIGARGDVADGAPHAALKTALGPGDRRETAGRGDADHRPHRGQAGPARSAHRARGCRRGGGAGAIWRTG